jgi:protein-S-isoprenylcysteine O-methyltransferase Ste14
MRNPIRRKNLSLRYLPFILLGASLVVWRAPTRTGWLVGLPLILAGTALRSWGAGHLVKNDVLTTTGPYAHLRHPLYLGTLAVATGFAAVIGGAGCLLILAFVWPWFALQYFPRKDRVECARLTALYGERFERYRAAVPALWPRARGWRDEGCARERDDSRSTAAGDPGADTAWRLERYSDNNELGTLLAVVVALALLVWRTGWGRT